MKYTCLATLLILFSSCFSKKPENTGLEGNPIPSFKILLTDSITYFDTKNLTNSKPAVLYYFGPNCPYSRAQMKELTDNMEKMQDIQFVVMTTAPFNQMRSFYSNYKLDQYKNVITGVDYSNQFIDYFSPKGVPFLAIYGASHKLNEVFSGETPAWQIRKVAYN